LKMSHGSGIPVSPPLHDAYGSARESSSVRFIQVKIIDEQLVNTGSSPVKGTAEEDFGAIQALLERNVPCYILYRLDTKNMHGFDWLLISYVPDGSPVKSRMLYASTLALLKRELGTSYFSDELHASAPDDVTWELYLQHDRKRGIADAPLTQSEISRSAAAELEIDPGHSREYVHSVLFPMSSQSVAALKNINAANVVQLKLDTQRETIELRGAFSSADVAGVRSKIPTDDPCFTFFKFSHDYEGEQSSPVVFIYSCPSNSKVRERMLYSTVKSAAIEAAASHGVTVDKKIEVTDAEDLNESDILQELHPEKREISTKSAFNRPSKPGRGRPRMTRK